jgi:phage tail-like protein
MTRRLSGSITVFDEPQKAALVWEFDNAWPQKWGASAMNAKTSDVAIEELEI